MTDEFAKYKLRSGKEFNELKDSIETLKAEYEAKLAVKDQEIKAIKEIQKLPSVKGSMKAEPVQSALAKLQSLSGEAKQKFYEANKDLFLSNLIDR